MNLKKILIILSLALLSAGCSAFQTKLPAGVVKSVNGGSDWQFSNAIASSTTASLVGLNISKLDFDPNNRQTVFVGTYTDGMFRSDDSGAHWNRVLSKIFVYDFAIKPGDAKTIYASGLCVDHGCVVKTTDGGASWTEIYKEGSVATASAVRTITINPLNLNQIIIGTASGSVIKSADSGNSWQLANDFKNQVNRILWQGGNVYALVKAKGLFISPGFADNFTDLTANLKSTYAAANLINNSDTIEAFNQVFVDFTSPTLIYITTSKGLFKTVDGGQNWTAQQLPLKPSESIVHAIAIARNSSNIVYTSVGSTIYKSLDAGQSWQTQNINSGGYINYILIDPQLPQIVYAGVYLNQ